MRDAVKSVAPDAVSIREFRRQRIERRVLRYGLMENRIKHRDHQSTKSISGARRSNDLQGGDIVKRRQLRQFFYLAHHLVGNSDGFIELIGPVYNTMSNTGNIAQASNALTSGAALVDPI
jgi:hypothetical protein